MTSVTAVGEGRVAPTSDAEPLRVSFLDGMRGLAALFVVIAHALAFNLPESSSAAGGVFATGALWDRAMYEGVDSAIILSRYAVVLFIVLSGCSLMLPVARSEDGALPGGVRNYVMRRARRILPPYYATLVLSLLFIALVPAMNDAETWGAVPAFDPGVLISHVLLVHNLSPDWAYRINPPLWTIPIEWQIYFVFPLVLLPLWRRFGELVTAGVGFAVGLALYFVVGPDRLIQSAPWFLGLFALGMTAASFAYRYESRKRWRRVWLPGVVAGLLAAFVIVAVAMRIMRVDFAPAGWITDIIFGAAVAVFIVHLGRVGRGGRLRSPALRQLERDPIVAVGWFSYSLYLMHAPIVMLTALAVQALDLPAWTYPGGVLLGVVVAIIGTYGFHLVFERPFMPRHLRRRISAVLPGGTPAGP